MLEELKAHIDLKFVQSDEKFLSLLKERDNKIATLEDNVLNLRKDVTRLEDLLDSESAYERRDTYYFR